MRTCLSAINKILFIVLIGFAIYIMKLSSLMIIFVSILPYLIKKIFHYEMSQLMIFIYYLFFLGANIGGGIFNLYYKFDPYDLIIHFISGILSTMVGFLIIKKNNLLKKENTMFIILFLLSFTILISFIWETLEFTYDNIFHKDSQWVEKTGVSDTMTDILISSLATIIIAFFYKINIKYNTKKTISFIKEIV